MKMRTNENERMQSVCEERTKRNGSSIRTIRSTRRFSFPMQLSTLLARNRYEDGAHDERNIYTKKRQRACAWKRKERKRCCHENFYPTTTSRAKKNGGEGGGGGGRREGIPIWIVVPPRSRIDGGAVGKKYNISDDATSTYVDLSFFFTSGFLLRKKGRKSRVKIADPPNSKK